MPDHTTFHRLPKPLQTRITFLMDTLNGANMAHVRFRISQAEAVADDEDEFVLSDTSAEASAYAGLVPQQEEKIGRAHV